MNLLIAASWERILKHSLLLSIGLLALVCPSRGSDTISQEIVRAVKEATVFIQVETDEWGKSGSGFVVHTDSGTVLVVTNHHVALKRPNGVSAKTPVIKVIFNSGTRLEHSYPAEVVASDSDRDLTVLKLTGVKDAPKPIVYANPTTLNETMEVYSFGFPFGQGLSTGKGFPAVTVGKASISSLRSGDKGELASIQIDGNLNPGNSGGPVVDVTGHLIGVAVSGIKDGQGIGFLIPALEVARTMEGRLGRVRVAVQAGPDGKHIARVEANVIDPVDCFRSTTAYYVLVPPKGNKPESGPLEKHPHRQKLALKVEKGVASAEFVVDKAEGEVMVQVVAERAPEKATLTTPLQSFSLYPRTKPENFAGPLPDGWKDTTPKDKSFSIWLPSNPTNQEEKRRNVAVNGKVVQVSSIVGKTADGLGYDAEYVVLPPGLASNSPARLHSMLRSALLDEGKGRFTESVEAKSGSLQGVQYRIEYGEAVARARVFISRGGVVRLVRVIGTADQVTSPEADTILLSFRLPSDSFATKTQEPPSAGKLPLPTTKGGVQSQGKSPTILGSVKDPKFKTIGPAGAILIGLEAKFTKFGSRDIVRAVRPIYRANGKEELGEQFGGNLTGAVTLKAKDGYAIGAISGKASLWCHGFSLTYMKIKSDGTLDIKDTYESEWAGWNGSMPVTKVEGDGTPVVGIVGKIVRTETTALGLLFKGQENFDPANGP